MQLRNLPNSYRTRLCFPIRVPNNCLASCQLCGAWLLCLWVLLYLRRCSIGMAAALYKRARLGYSNDNYAKLSPRINNHGFSYFGVNFQGHMVWSCVYVSQLLRLLLRHWPSFSFISLPLVVTKNDQTDFYLAGSFSCIRRLWSKIGLMYRVNFSVMIRQTVLNEKCVKVYQTLYRCCCHLWLT